MIRTYPSAARPSTQPGAPRRRAGMTIIEVLVTLLLISVALMALGRTSGAVAALQRGGSYQMRAAMIVQSRLDSLASIACRQLVANGGSVGPITVTSADGAIVERWRLADLDNVILITDSVTVRGRANVLVYNSMVPCRN